jgi:SAM-dependent methyltransferase
VSELEFTGERFIPGTQGEIWVEHWHRYHFASRWAAGRRVLDLACGEGYGSALLACMAAQVTGVDVSPQAVRHASETYVALPNLRFVEGSCSRIPLPDESIDLAVSFETLEHIEEQREFLTELARVLAPGGLLLLSCPNKAEYSDRRGFANEFHVKELYRDELATLVGAHFPAIEWYGQKPTFFSVIAPDAGAHAAQLVEVDPSAPARAEPAFSAPLYFLLLAARDPASLAAAPRLQSVLSDRSEWVHRDYEKVMGWMQQLAGEREALLAKVAAALAATARLEGEAAERERELERRRGWRWWLRLPLVRLGLLR